MNIPRNFPPPNLPMMNENFFPMNMNPNDLQRALAVQFNKNIFQGKIFLYLSSLKKFFFLLK